MNYRLGFDLGYTSLGWACILLDNDDQPCEVHDFGARIFPSGRDAKSKQPTSVERRKKRGARRNRDRYLARRSRLLAQMIAFGLQPENQSERRELAKQEPLALRAKGISEQLTPFELGRALFHLNQRRGFQSNRIAKRQGGEDEAGLKKGIHALEGRLQESRQTLGQYLYARLEKNLNTRLSKEETDERWTSRQMYRDEFERLMKTQQIYHPTLLADDVVAALRETIFYQRPLKIKEAGFCALLDGKRRARLAYPQMQRFRIYQEVNNLDTVKETADTPEITPEMRQQLVQYLCEDFSKLRKDGVLSWHAIQKIIGIKGVKFNLDALGRGGLQADTTSRAMMTAAPDWWPTLDDTQQRDVVDAVMSAQTDTDLQQRLKVKFDALPERISAALAKVSLPEGYGRISIDAAELLLPPLSEGKVYSDACRSVGINHSDDYDGLLYTQGDLPFYGEVLQKHVVGGIRTAQYREKPEVYYGKINNPTVHMALNQFRRVLNELVQQYGCAPKEIHLELARETALSAKDLAKLNQEHSNNRRNNEKINEILRKLNVAESYDNRMKYRLWEDLDNDPSGRCCPLSGKVISLDLLFSSQIEVEHIIPFSRSFDDSRNNKMVCFKLDNVLKGDDTPYEAFGQSDKWPDILARAKKMSPDVHKGGKNASGFRVNKFWRFLPDAMEQLQGDAESFLARQLNDTKYMTRVARRYAEYVAGKNHVLAIKGKFTADLRHHWGLDELTGNLVEGRFQKDRSNHHHHAIDAIVIALSSPSMIQKLAQANKRAYKQEADKMDLDVPLPFPDFSVAEIKARLQTLVISHKQNHKSPEQARAHGGSIGQLHEDTNYGHIHDNIYATRKDLLADKFSSRKDIDEIASRTIREAVMALFEPYADEKGKLKDSNKTAYHQGLEAFKQQYGVKKVRIHQAKNGLIPICDSDGHAYRYVIGGNNFCAEIWMPTKGKKAGKWQCEIIRNFDINQKNFLPKWRQENPTAMKIMRLQINDMVALDRDGKRVICRVQKMNVRGQVILRHHNDSETKDSTGISTSAGTLQSQNARKLFVSPSGRVYDPGRAKQPKQKG
ncbi:type II CRISPR RNA-guided endonuclease Cas9 [Uruburuella testudinis]|uniref:CRISPR-associated endonuclease Cas9 n=1 Tax=Uruburuella testudinis TaxID=1282863 RepID=A0ABY4DTP3_9NEIS|nr:type II CRISPR RNA-guided endonuclease Cas9 [Uruburuella testudinis]UOO82253.1 type II CRISPR RNA-guided endonuclease Cas9 [Uruburuella testudinis]